MFIISLTYKVPTTEVDPYLEAHVEFLKEHYENGTFLLSGRKVPRTGGIILAKCENLEKLEEIVRRDPFLKYGIAEIDITEFNSTMVGEGLESLLD